MSEVTRLVVCEALKTTTLVDTEDGQRIHGLVAAEIEKGNRVVLSFAGTTQLITAFLNAAIGQLYNEFEEGRIRRQLRFEDIDPIFGETITQTIKRAKEYFSDQARIASIQDKFSGNDEE